MGFSGCVRPTRNFSRALLLLKFSAMPRFMMRYMGCCVESPHSAISIHNTATDRQSARTSRGTRRCDRSIDSLPARPDSFSDQVTVPFCIQ